MMYLRKGGRNQADTGTLYVAAWRSHHAKAQGSHSDTRHSQAIAISPRHVSHYGCNVENIMGCTVLIIIHSVGSILNMCINSFKTPNDL